MTPHHRDSLRPVLLGCAITLAVSLVFAAPSRAYIDPGSGSYLFQFAIAAVAGALYGVKLFWSRLRPLFFSIFFFWKRR